MKGGQVVAAGLVAWLGRPAAAWNSWGAVDQVYNYEQFYTDAQYLDHCLTFTLNK